MAKKGVMKPVLIRVPTQMLEDLSRIRDERKVTLTSLIREAIREYVIRWQETKVLHDFIIKNFDGGNPSAGELLKRLMEEVAK